MVFNNKYISIVLSTYNDEKYIRQSIESVLNQTYPYFEFIIISDGSTDKTVEIIKEFDDKRIVLIDKTNTGLIDSLNIGFKKSKYDWVMRMDGDDICESDRLITLVKNIDNSVAVIGSQCILINEKNEPIGSTWLKFQHEEILKRLKLQLPNIIHPSTLINLRLFKLVGGYDKYIYVAEDYDLWLRMSKFGKLMNLKNKLLKYRIHEQNISIKKREIQFLNTQIAFYKFKYKINLIKNEAEYTEIKYRIENNIYYKLALFSIKKIDHKNIFISKINKTLFLIFSYLLKINF